MAATCGSIRAHEGWAKTPTFEAFVPESLAPCLEPGDVVVWDNARIHSPAAVALIEAVGARVLAQPPYSPDLNVIEPPWSKVKGLVRQKLADALDTQLSALDEAVLAITPTDYRRLGLDQALRLRLPTQVSYDVILAVRSPS